MAAPKPVPRPEPKTKEPMSEIEKLRAENGNLRAQLNSTEYYKAYIDWKQEATTYKNKYTAAKQGWVNADAMIAKIGIDRFDEEKVWTDKVIDLEQQIEEYDKWADSMTKALDFRDRLMAKCENNFENEYNTYIKEVWKDLDALEETTGQEKDAKRLKTKAAMKAVRGIPQILKRPVRRTVVVAPTAGGGGSSTSVPKGSSSSTLLF